MNAITRQGLLGAVLLCAFTLPGMAEDLSPFSLKLRAGSVSGSITEQSLGHRTYGFGLDYAHKVGRGRWTFEVSYEGFNGYRRETTEFGPAWYAANQNPFAPTGATRTFTPAGSSKSYAVVIRPDDSLQGESMVFRGFGLRVGYGAPIPFELFSGWDWQVGMTLDRRETHHEVFMTLNPGYFDDKNEFQKIPANGYGDPNYYEGANFSRNASKLLPGAYIGMGRDFSDIFRFEMNLRTTGFNDVRYRPFTTTGTAPRYDEKTRSGFVVEFALGVKI